MAADLPGGDCHDRINLRGHMGSVGIPEVVVILAIITMSLVLVWPAGRICSRIGFSPWLGLLAVVPIVNVLLLWYVAFAPWPRAPLGRGGA
jgi:hypothetical protein